MKYYKLIIPFLLLTSTQLPAQLLLEEEGDVIIKNFKFDDGIYTTYEEFQKNEPTYTWKEVKASVYTNPQTYVTQIEHIIHEGQLLKLDELWGVCFGGIPYVYQPKELLGKQNETFVGLKLRGKICYLEFETQETLELMMPVYNPHTGKPFRKALIKREYTKNYAKILNFESGEIKPFTISNLLDWIADDSELVKTVSEMNTLEAEEKLFKCLLIYVDRNSARLKTEG